MPNIVHVAVMAPKQALISPQRLATRLSEVIKVMVVMPMAVTLRLPSRPRPSPKLKPLTAGANRLSTVMLDTAARPAASTAAGANRLSTVMLDMAARPATSTAAGANRLSMVMLVMAEVKVAIKVVTVANK